MSIIYTLFLLIILAAQVQNEDLGKKLQDIAESYKNPLSHGFGDDIDWIPWEEAIETALERNKPIFMLIHKTWCHACKSLRKIMQQSNAKKAFKKLSEYFVMVNTADDEEPFEEEYRPDGNYVPRVLFLDMNGDLLSEFKNKKAEYKNYAYYYSNPADIMNSMKDVIAYYGIELPHEKKADKLKPKKPPPKNAPEGPDSSKKIKKPADDEGKEEAKFVKNDEKKSEQQKNEENKKEEKRQNKKEDRKEL